MSTHAFIGITRKNPGSQEPHVEYIYCHLDGHPPEAGATLLEHYQDPDKLDALVALGDLTCLGPTLLNIPVGLNDDLTPCTTARHRDHKMPWEKCQPMTIGSTRGFWNLLETSSVTYLYLHDRDGWMVSGAGNGPGRLGDVLEKPDENTLTVQQEDTPATNLRKFTSGVTAGFSHDGRLVEINS